MEFGERIREIRKTQNLSMKNLGEKVNVSASMISQLERGLVNPSVNLLKNIANNLNVSVGDFFSGETTPSVVIRKNERARIVYKDGKMIHELLAPITNRKIEFIYNIYKPGGMCDVITHNGEECALVLQGSAELGLGDEVYYLEEGDSLYHDSTIPHYIKNIGTCDLCIVYAITPPSY